MNVCYEHVSLFSLLSQSFGQSLDSKRIDRTKQRLEYASDIADVHKRYILTNIINWGITVATRLKPSLVNLPNLNYLGLFFYD